MEVLPIKRGEMGLWCMEKHYAHRIPSITWAFGLYVSGLLEGVVSYGTPASSTLLRGVAGDEWADRVLELNRLCINSGVPKNSASTLVGRSIGQLPKPSIIVSYADTSVGHVGYIYQATNFIYTGLSAKFRDPKVVGLEHLHHASYGHGKTNEQLESEFGENLYFEDRPRKHRYIYIHASKADKKKINLRYTEEPYPKGTTKKTESTDIKRHQITLF